MRRYGVKILSISSGEWSASFVPEYGMNTYSLRYGDEAILREAGDISAFAESPLWYGIPVIMPANRTKGAKFEFEGVEYTYP